MGSVANEETFWDDFIPLAQQEHISFFGFEGFDEPWKTDEGLPGPNWGLYSADRTPKGPVTSFVPVDGGETIDLSTRPGNEASLYNTGGWIGME